MLTLPTAGTLWTLAGMPKARPFVDADDARGAPMAPYWPPASERPENRGSFNLTALLEHKRPTEFTCVACMQIRPIHQRHDGDRCVDCWDAELRHSRLLPITKPSLIRHGVATTTAGAELIGRLLSAGLTERQAVVLLNSQAGWIAEEIHEALGIARSTVAAHLAAARKILRRNIETD